MNEVLQFIPLLFEDAQFLLLFGGDKNIILSARLAIHGMRKAILGLRSALTKQYSYRFKMM